MSKISGYTCLVFLVILPSVLLAQGKESWLSQQPFSHLDPAPYDPQTDPDIDMYISHWKNAIPRITLGNLIIYDILTKCDGDVLHPTKKGAVLHYIERISYATLEAGQSTTPDMLKTAQDILYITSGKGTIKAGNRIADLKSDVGVLLPPGLNFIITNTGDEPLSMFIIGESLPKGFIPNTEIIVRDERTIPLVNIPGHWAHVPKSLFWQEDHNTAIFIGINPVWIDPMTMSQPHSHQPGVEEVWLSLEGEADILLGKQIRRFTPGMAMRIPPTGNTPHSTINIGDKPIKIMWMMRIPTYRGMSPLNVD